MPAHATPFPDAPRSLRRWTTASVPSAERLDYWVGAICEGFLEMSATAATTGAGSGRRGFESQLDSVSWGAVSVNRVRGSGQHVYRSRAAIGRAKDHYCYLLCKTDGAWTAVQEERRAQLLPGDLVLIDSRQRYEFHFPERADSISLQLDPDWLATWLPDPQQCFGRRIDAQEGWGAALGAFVRQLTPELALAPPLPVALLVDQLGALLALAGGAGTHAVTHAGSGGRRSSVAADALRQKIAAAVRERHAEPGLTAGAIADAIGVSVRTLHRTLSAGEASFAQLLMAARMEVVRRLLADPRFDRLTIAEIGRRVGLADTSHFVRLCRSQLGGTPGRLRRRSG